MKPDEALIEKYKSEIYSDDFITKVSLLMVANPKATNDEKAGQYSKECWDCIHLRTVPGNAHIKCVRPDVEMSGNSHGIKNGWFMYPLLFDPTWKTKQCDNYQSKSVNRAISQETKVD